MQTVAAIAYFILYALCSGISLILLKSGLATFEFRLSAILGNWKLLTGFGGYVAGFILWMFILSRYRLNTAFPIAMSLFFIVSGLGSFFILKEPLTARQAAGMAVCLTGIMLIAIK